MTRSLVGIVLLVMGAVTLIALILPGRGALTDWWRNMIAPWFGSGRWLLPFVLLAVGFSIERARSAGTEWSLTLLGTAVSGLGALGVVQLLDARRGGILGRAMTDTLAPLLTRPGAFVLCAALAVGGALVALDMSLPTVVGPVLLTLRRAAERLVARPQAAAGAASARPGGAGARGVRDEASSRGGAIPSPTPSSAPVSATFAAGVPSPEQVAAAAATLAPSAGERPRAVATLDGREREGGEDWPRRAPDDVTDAGDASPTREHREYTLPPLTLLDDVAATNGTDPTDHARHAKNAAIITAKLASFNIPAEVTAYNAGPVVTQYEVRPAPDIKLSRIEALADDLAMALAARAIRIEAPIPGKDVVGLEIPNKDFNIVALRRILEEPEARSALSPLTFALGRDVAGHARSVDLAKMPHLLIAGATGSGKSVMVNALITSLLCRSTPDQVRMILMDLKRVELAAYNGLPHLMVPVITEPERAKAALKWAVTEMENRYRRFAGASARNIAAYNESRADAADRLPQLVIIIDELADLMMREGKNVEDPIVRLAQKARATGIHMVLATQRPSVNVVTGLIKANFPSRIAFAMASQIDSRTILDAPGAEDLIGRGDMLYQPADLPRPMRLQGVFVSDKEIGRITEHWRAEAEPHYDLAVIESDEDGTGRAEDLPDEEADRLLPDAVGVIQEYDRASASLLQRRLKIGYARAARIIDQLEARGYIGAFDGSNARPVLRRDGPGPDGGDGLPDDEDEV
ncbi:MAG TPA: DNA translocase FtsK [Candidatus Limnocylindrales bacterium]